MTVAAVAVGGMLAAGLAATTPAQAMAVFDVTDFGATGNGVTDDSQAFRDAIAAADAAAGTNTVLVPAGTYALDRSNNSVPGVVRMIGVTNVNVVGEGAASVVKWKPRNWSTGSDPHLFFCDGCSFVSFSDLAVDGSDGEPGFSGQEQMHALQFRNSADLTVDQVSFTDTFGDGVGVIGDLGGITEDVVVSNSTFTSSNRSGIGVQGGTRRMQFLTNHFEAGIDQDIDFEPTGSNDTPPRPGPEDVLIQGNTFVRDEDAACRPPIGSEQGQQCTIAVTIGGQFATNRAKRVQFLDNQLTDSAVQLFQTEDVTLEGNTSSSDIEQNTPLLNIFGSTVGTTVRDNTFESTNPGKPVIAVVESNMSLPGDMIIEQNRIRQFSTGDGISVTRAIGPVVIRDNPELTGGGAGVGIRYNLTIGDGILREPAELSGNTIQRFTTAAVFLNAVGTAKFSTATMCDNDVSDQTTGIRLQLADASSIGEAVVCGNVWAPEVTTPVTTDKVTHFRGTGSPEGIVAAPVASEFIRTDEADRLYIKQTGSGKTGWVGQ
jgi:hypothetical protein